MQFQLINYFFFALLLLSFIVLLDIILKFKNSLILKSMLISLVVGIGLNAIGNLYTSINGYNRWMVELPYTLIFFGGFNFFSFIYSHNIKNRVLVFTTSMFIVQFFFLFFFTWIHPVNQHLKVNDIAELGLFRKAVKILYSIVSFVIIIDLCIKITNKYANDNLYFKQMRKWSFAIGLVFSLCMIVHILKTVSSNSDAVITIVKACSHLAALLFIIYRPNFLNYTNLTVSLSSTFNFANTKSFKNSAFIVEFFDKLYFLNTEASVSDLAIKLDTNVECLNEYIKDKFDLTFSELVNKHRIEYFVSLISSREFTNLTIDALSEKAGFSSRQNLNKSFKKFHGGTPSDLIKALAISN